MWNRGNVHISTLQPVRKWIIIQFYISFRKMIICRFTVPNMLLLFIWLSCVCYFQKLGRKIIGARFYYKGFSAEYGPLELFNQTFFLSPRDNDGHGSHVASTIAGALVSNISLFGQAKGNARGGASNARLSIYKACWFNFCSDADVLAALDDAISDGVDIVSMSLGPDPPQLNYFEDAISVGTFHAFQKGILVSASAGNSFFPQTASNVAPWILTVAASTIDREIQSNIYLGNSKLIKVISFSKESLSTNAILIRTNSAMPSVQEGDS